MDTVRPDSQLLTVEDLADRLKVRPSWVYGHAEDLGAYKVGKYLRFSWERVLERLPKLGPAPNDPKTGLANHRVAETIERICNK